LPRGSILAVSKLHEASSRGQCSRKLEHFGKGVPHDIEGKLSSPVLQKEICKNREEELALMGCFPKTGYCAIRHRLHLDVFA
jgi:hypothetical protein